MLEINISLLHSQLLVQTRYYTCVNSVLFMCIENIIENPEFARHGHY